MEQNGQAADEMIHAMDTLWIRNNIGFLARYWRTAKEALNNVASNPGGFTEFQDEPLGESYVAAVVANHLEHHNHSGILLAYAAMDEFMTVLSVRLGEVRDAPIAPNELRDRGVERYKKFIHKVCRIPAGDTKIDWPFLQDLSIVRNAIIHANGNRSLLSNPNQLEKVVERRRPKLSFKQESRLIVSDEFVLEAIMAIGNAALAVNALARPEAPGVTTRSSITAESKNS